MRRIFELIQFLQNLQRFPHLAVTLYLCISNKKEMQLPQHIVDLVGTLLYKGWNDEQICNAAIQVATSQDNISYSLIWPKTIPAFGQYLFKNLAGFLLLRSQPQSCRSRI